MEIIKFDVTDVILTSENLNSDVIDGGDGSSSSEVNLDDIEDEGDD